MASTDEKKRTQEASETNFTTRGGRQDATSGTKPAALESLPRLVGALPGSYYLHDIIDEIDEAHYQRELKQFKKYSPDKDPDPEEEEYWRHETKHSIS